MKKFVGMFVPLVSVSLLFALGYYANSTNLLQGVSREFQRYSGLNTNHLMLGIALLLLSFLFGYLFTKVNRVKTA